MLFLLHGTDVSSSRQALVDLRKNYSPDSISTFDAKKFDNDELLRVYQSSPLLGDRRLVVIEGKLPPSTIQQFNNLTISDTTDLVFWIDEELKPSNKIFKLVKESGGQIRLFREKIPRHVFGFLDALGYKNRRKAFLELHRLLDQGETPLYLLTMITWQIRNLLKVKLRSPDVKKMNPYVLRKVQNQAKNFTEERLIDIFGNLLNTELKLKTTQTDPTLVLDRLVESVTRR